MKTNLKREILIGCIFVIVGFAGFVSTQSFFQQCFEEGMFPTGFWSCSHLFEITIPQAFAEEEKIIPPPHKQIELGIKLAHIICDDDKVPTWNVHEKPACVFLESENKLLKRGWAHGDSIPF